MKSEKLLLIGSSGLIGSSILTVAKNYFSSIVCVGSDHVINYENGSRFYSARNDKAGWSDIAPHIDSNTLVINAAWGRNTSNDRNSKMQIEFSERELGLIHSVKGRISKYISFGSIAEIDDSEISPSNKTLYSDAKKRIFRELQEIGIPHLWIRLASIYGQNDKRSWLMNQLIANAKTANRIALKSPNQLINLCHTDSLAREVFKIQLLTNNTVLNAYTKEWLTVEELANSFNLKIEPKLSYVSSNFFSSHDPHGYLIETPPILDFIRSSISHE